MGGYSQRCGLVGFTGEHFRIKNNWRTAKLQIAKVFSPLACVGFLRGLNGWLTLNIWTGCQNRVLDLAGKGR